MKIMEDVKYQLINRHIYNRVVQNMCNGIHKRLKVEDFTFHSDLPKLVQFHERPVLFYTYLHDNRKL